MTMSDFIAELKKIAGAAHVITDPGELAPYITEHYARFTGKGLAVVKPATTQEVAEIVKLCAAHGIAITPQGGNTGLVGGSVPTVNDSIVLNLSRMNAVRAIDNDNFTITVEAGCILQNVQQVVAEQGRFFPLSVASEGSCMIGGNIATNAGGILTLRYGNMRDQVLGLEVVLADGTVIDALRGLRKDNAGYDLKQLFISSEGTLGIVTAAVLKTYPDPGGRETFFAATDDLHKVVTLLSDIRKTFGGNLMAYEVLSSFAMDFAVAYHPQVTKPVAMDAPWYVLCEVTGARDGALRAQLEDALAAAFEKNLIQDATMAQNETQRRLFWQLRESVSDAQQNIGASIKHDISVPVSKIPDFVRDATECVENMIAGIRPVTFGHVGDGNLHFNFTQPIGSDRAAFMERWDEVAHRVHDLVMQYGGSISAEHGIGTFKAHELGQRRSANELHLMRTLKSALDPQNIMNPGKVLEE